MIKIKFICAALKKLIHRKKKDKISWSKRLLIWILCHCP